MTRTKSYFLSDKRTLGAKPGFTLIELALVIVIIVIIGGLSAPVFQSFQVENNLDLAADNTAHALRRAQLLSQASSEDSSWGVYIAGDGITLFKGGSFSGRDAAFDEFFQMPGSIILAGAKEVVYSKMYGEPQIALPSTVTFSSVNGETRSVVLESKGTVDY